MKTILLSAAGIIASTVLLSFNSGPVRTPPASPEDQTFFMKAASGGTFEIKTAQLAMARDSANQEIMSFAKQMIADHTKLGDALKATAAAKGVTVRDTLIGDDAANYAALDAKSGADFEKSYVSMNVLGHEKSLALHKKEEQSTKDAQIKSTVKSAIPVISHHLMMARMLDRKYKNK